MQRFFPGRASAARLFLAGLILCASALTAAAAAHVRGQITAISGDIVTVKTTSGETVEVTTEPKFAIVVFRKISINDLKAEDYLSIPSVKAHDGGKRALAINVFPPALNGTGEGETAWDLGEGSRMTNASFATMQSQGSDHTIVVSYGGKQETINVPDGTPITRFAPVRNRKLAVGENVVFFANETDGKVTAGRAGVTEDGSMPPI